MLSKSLSCFFQYFKFYTCAILSDQKRGTAPCYVYKGKSTKKDWNHKAFSHEISKKVFEVWEKVCIFAVEQ